MSILVTKSRYEYHERYHSEKRKDGRVETDVSGILFLHHKNGILELYPGLIGNFFTIKNFIVKHYKELDDEELT